MIDDDQLHRIADTLMGTCRTIASVLDEFELDYDASEVEDALVGIECECCECGWWMESSELVDGDGEVVGCEDCRDE